MGHLELPKVLPQAKEVEKDSVERAGSQKCGMEQAHGTNVNAPLRSFADPSRGNAREPLVYSLTEGNKFGVTEEGCPESDRSLYLKAKRNEQEK